MRLIVAALILVANSFGAIALVNQVKCDSSTADCTVVASTSLALTVSSPAQANFFIAMTGSSVATNTTVSSITQTNVTWTVVKTCNVARTAEIWKGIPSGTPGATVTIAWANTPTTMFANVSQWSGVLSTGTVTDGTAGCSGTAGTTQTTASITLANAGSLIVAVDRANVNFSSGPTGSFTDMTHTTVNQLFPAYRLPGSTGTYSTSWTTGSSAQNDTAIAAFLPATPTGGPIAIY